MVARSVVTVVVVQTEAKGKSTVVEGELIAGRTVSTVVKGVLMACWDALMGASGCLGKGGGCVASTRGK